MWLLVCIAPIALDGRQYKATKVEHDKSQSVRFLVLVVYILHSTYNIEKYRKQNQVGKGLKEFPTVAYPVFSAMLQ
jgi:hypothetical protein